MPHLVDPYEDFWEGLRRSIASGKKPPATVLEVRCARRSHRLLSLVKSPDGLIPVPRPSEVSPSFEVSFVEGSAIHPRTLRDRGEQERLPVGDCECGGFDGPLVADVQAWLKQGLRYVRIAADGTRAN